MNNLNLLAHQSFSENFLETDQLQTWLEADLGFLNFCDDSSLYSKSQATSQKFSSYRHFIHIGIGGSALGTQMLIEALAPEKKKQFTFLSNIDPDDIFIELNQPRDWSQTIVYIVSKSGSTVETTALLKIVIGYLEKNGILKEQFKNHLVVCTDPHKSTLLDFALRYHLESLPLPTAIGGRYSALTPVGLFPLAWAGVDIDLIKNAAIEFKKNSKNTQWLKKHLIPYAHLFSQSMFQGKSQTVIMPYSSILRQFGFWFSQLWAESLGKDGLGLTPISSYGATDQHSLLQLFNDGPDDKIYILIKVKNTRHDFNFSDSLKDLFFNSLEDLTLQKLLLAECDGTIKALTDKGRIIIEIQLDQIKPEVLTNLILWSECLTAQVGFNLEIDPFNQPGVENSKNYTRSILNKQ